MKTANQLLLEIFHHVAPHRASTISITEAEPTTNEQTNWVANSNGMGPDKVALFTRKIAELRKSDRLVDWSTVPPPAAKGARKHIWKRVTETDNWDWLSS
jgi:hypothetical protein